MLRVYAEDAGREPNFVAPKPRQGSNPMENHRNLPGQGKQPRPRRRIISKRGCGCLLPLLGVILLLAIYFLVPVRTNLLLLGLDTRLSDDMLGRSDTNILVTVVPLRPYVGLLSIPRDLWVTIPGYGENRINTANFFAEAEQPGSGPAAAKETVAFNFGVPVHYYVRIRFEGLRAFIDAMDGIEVDLPSPMAGFSPGRQLLDGEQALALVRDRQGSDDFFRMARGQLLLRSLLKSWRRPELWRNLPAVVTAIPQLIDTDLPVWLWPRLGLAFLRAGSDGVDFQVISREMVTPFTTPAGASVLAPDWEKINPLIANMFGG